MVMALFEVVGNKVFDLEYIPTSACLFFVTGIIILAFSEGKK